MVGKHLIRPLHRVSDWKVWLDGAELLWSVSSTAVSLMEQQRAEIYHDLCVKAVVAQ